MLQHTTIKPSPFLCVPKSNQTHFPISRPKEWIVENTTCCVPLWSTALLKSTYNRRVANSQEIDEETKPYLFINIQNVIQHGGATRLLLNTLQTEPLNEIITYINCKAKKLALEEKFQQLENEKARYQKNENVFEIPLYEEELDRLNNRFSEIENKYNSLVKSFNENKIESEIENKLTLLIREVDIFLAILDVDTKRRTTYYPSCEPRKAVLTNLKLIWNAVVYDIQPLEEIMKTTSLEEIERLSSRLASITKFSGPIFYEVTH